MRVIKRLFLGLVVLVLLLVAGGFFLPSSAHLERSTVVNAPPEKIHAIVNDFQTFNKWSPWFSLDPKATYKYEGPATGVGSKMSWHSDDPNVGSGSQEIVESTAPQFVRTKLDFGEQGTALAFYRIEPDGAATRVTWGFDTDFGYNLPGRYFGLMMESMLAPDYEKGLANLKKLAEQPAGAETVQAATES